MMNEDVKKSIKESVLCWLATSNENGEPNVSPKEIFDAYDDNSLLIANVASPNSVNNINKNKHVCISFVDIFKQKGYKLKGVAEVVTPEEKSFVHLLKELKHLSGDNYPIKSIIKIEVNSVAPIIAPSYWLFPEKTTEKSMIEQSLSTYRVKK
ncbi:MAG TPA: pyridoxamine 5'-phosphate oxidase family protein [Gammaproteobacteria bacterium]|nr:pyridoxamine 5'-phosphate oxidase family protein [Xanthomonadales bacterium]HPI94604.1 pyridoxamine 5'-phosphate oxidase family protein [Gammaproteobacteria bacterium]HPQ86049.1 pyridoxamine 5'-phosphate oxidase family protein [Gammaproteobacteria bacterium]